MKVYRKQAYQNQRCHECGNLVKEMYIVMPERTRKEWRLCYECYKKLFKNKNDKVR